MDGLQLCYLIAIVISICFLVFGFMELLKGKQKHEVTETQVISRQIRGFAFIMLSQVIMVVGFLLCYGIGGSKKLTLKSLLKDVGMKRYDPVDLGGGRGEV